MPKINTRINELANRMPKPSEIAIGIRNRACKEVSKIIGIRPQKGVDGDGMHVSFSREFNGEDLAADLKAIGAALGDPVMLRVFKQELLHLLDVNFLPHHFGKKQNNLIRLHLYMSVNYVDI